jgi:hypothetical protein
VYTTQGVINFFFLSSPPQYTCSSLENDAVVLLLLVEGPVVVTGGEGEGDQASFYLASKVSIAKCYDTDYEELETY